MARPVSTYSIAACDLDRGQWGVATQSKFLAVGSIVPWAEPGAGAIATQAYANPRYGPDGLALLRQGLTAEEVVRRLTEADDGRDERQLGVVDGAGRGATYTGVGLPRLGRRARRRRIRRAGEHPRLGRHRRGARSLVRGERRIVGRAPDRGSGGGAGGRWRQAGAAVGRRARRRARRRLRGPHRHARRPPRRRPRGADRGTAPPLRPAPAAVREDAARPVAADRRRAAGRDRRASQPSSATSGWPTGPAMRTSRSASTATARSIRSSWPS